MDLLEYPRPRNDNGRGVHWFPTLGQRRSVVDENLSRLTDLKMRWLVLWNGLDDAALLVNDYLIKRLVSAGITPVMHIYLRPIAPLDDAALTRLHRLVAFYRDPQRRVDYFQLFYEPNVAGEWADGQMPDGVVGKYLDAWLPAAQEVVNAGGLPGFAPLWPGGDYDDMRFLEEGLQAIQDRGQGLILDKAWIALHNYNLGHGLGEPEDPNGFHRYAWVDRVVRERVGRPLPLLTTEGGTRAGDPPYGDGAGEEQVSADTVAAYEFIKAAPDSYFCYCPWLFGNLLGGGDDAGWEPMAWFTADGERPVVAAVRALEDSVRARASAEAPAAVGREKFFEDTGHWVRGPFFEFFTRHGLDLCGYPLGEAAVENGLPTQYFQKVVLEEYWPGRIRLRPAGSELVDLHVQVAQTQGQLEPLQKEIVELQERLRQGMAVVTPAAVPAAAETPRPMTTEASALAERLAAAEYEVKRLRDQNTRMEALLATPQVATNTGELAAVAAGELYKLQNRVEELQTALATTTAQAEQSAVARAEAVARLDELQGRIVNGEAYALASREALEVAELVKDLETKLAAAEERIQMQADKQAADEEHLRQLEIEKVRTADQLKAAAEQAAALQEKVTASESQATTALQQLQRLEADKTALAGKIADLQTRLKKAEEAPPGLTVHQLKDRIAQLEAALVDSQTAVQSMMSDKPMISQVMDKWKSAQQSLGGAAETARLQAQVTDLEQQLADARLQVGGLREALADAKGKVNELQKAAKSASEAAAASAREAGLADVPQAAVPKRGADREPGFQELQARATEMEAFVGKIQAEMRRLLEQNKQLAGHVAELEAAARRKG